MFWGPDVLILEVCDQLIMLNFHLFLNRWCFLYIVKKHCKTPSENGPAVDCIRIGARVMPTLHSGRVCRVRASDGPSPPTTMLSASLLSHPHLYATARRLAQPLLPSFLPHLPWTIDLLLWDRNLGVVQSFFGGSVQSVVWFGSMKERRWLAWPAPVWDRKLGSQSGFAELQFSYGVIKFRVKYSFK